MVQGFDQVWHKRNRQHVEEIANFSLFGPVDRAVRKRKVKFGPVDRKRIEARAILHVEAKKHHRVNLMSTPSQHHIQHLNVAVRRPSPLARAESVR